MNSRGQITPDIKDKAKDLLGIDDISTAELRLMPYIQYTMMNSQRIDTKSINKEERKILSNWRKNGWIEGGASEMGITKEFWTAINEILWLGYVDYTG